MRQKKAKQLRKQVYGDKDFRERTYGKTPKGPIIVTESGMKVSSRRIYQKLKKKMS